jgi:WD40 repeat protein
MQFSLKTISFLIFILTFPCFVSISSAQTDLSSVYFAHYNPNGVGDNTISDASPDGKMIAVSTIHTLCFYTWEGELLRKIDMRNVGFITRLRWLPNGKKVVCASFNNSILLADPSSDKIELVPIKYAQEGRKREQIFNAIAPSPDSKKLATAMGDGLVRIFSLENGNILDSVVATQSPMGSYAVAFFPDGQKLLCDASGANFCIFDLKTRQKQALKTDKTLCINAFAVAKNGNQFLVGTMNNDAHLELWDAKIKKRLRTFELPCEYAIQHVKFSKDEQKILATNSYFGASIFNIKQEKWRDTFQVYGAHAAFWSPDERSLCIAGSRYIRLQALEKGRVFKQKETIVPPELSENATPKLPKDSSHTLPQSEVKEINGETRVYAIPLEEVNDSTQLIYAEKNISDYLKYPSFTPQNPDDAASKMNTAAWYALLTGDFAKAERYCRQGLGYAPKNLYLPTNLAAALLLQNKMADAKKIYLDLAPIPFDEKRSYRDIFLEDLKSFEAKPELLKSVKKNIDAAKLWLKN